MKKILLPLRSLLTLVAAVIALGVSAQSWDFSALGDEDKANLDADNVNWSYDAGKERWMNVLQLNNEPLKANGVELSFTKGLKVTTGATADDKNVNDQVRIDPKSKCLTLNNKGTKLIIPDLKAGNTVAVEAKCSSKTDARYLTATNLTPVEGFSASSAATSSTTVTHKGKVDADGDVVISTTGGMYVYKITVAAESETPVNPSAEDHSVAMNPMVNQMMLRINDNSVKYYNTSDLESVSFDKTDETVRVTPKVADWQDRYLRNVSEIFFSKKASAGSEGKITNRGVDITDAKGWLESAYVKWTPFTGATSYNVYVKGGKYSDYTIIDRQLVRDYGTYCRADMVGLPANVYSLKVVPVVNGVEDTESASEATDMAVKAYDRSGFAFHKGAGEATYDGKGIGAYKENGELKDDAKVIYITAETAKTVKLGVKQNKKNDVETEFTGLQAILGAYQKKDVTNAPLCVRIIGTVKDTDMDSFGSKAEGLQIKGATDYVPLNITIEGIGDDATTWGFGFLVRSCSSIEFRNFANMLCMDDALSFDTKNSHCWVHHMDFFYGNAGGDSDQAKGDGTVDIKGNSQYMTVAYNHFWDNGKTSLCGMTSENGPNYIDYHHNWFDHSDSRHPRVRTMTVHVWNNYYDGVAKYGVGATTGSNVFVENNFYRHTKDPMMISLQGTDGKGDGTFSGENGGMIKSYGNLYAEKGTSSNYTVITHKVAPTDFDCYEASSRDENVPSSYVTKKGETSYSNFDIDSELMHAYNVTPTTDVPSEVMGYYGAGRMNKGDFQWAFDNAKEDTNYSVISGLKTALQNYTGKLVKVF